VSIAKCDPHPLSVSEGFHEVGIFGIRRQDSLMEPIQLRVGFLDLFACFLIHLGLRLREHLRARSEKNDHEEEKDSGSHA